MCTRVLVCVHVNVYTGAVCRVSVCTGISVSVCVHMSVTRVYTLVCVRVSVRVYMS